MLIPTGTRTLIRLQQEETYSRQTGSRMVRILNEDGESSKPDSQLSRHVRTFIPFAGPTVTDEAPSSDVVRTCSIVASSTVVDSLIPTQYGIPSPDSLEKQAFPADGFYSITRSSSSTVTEMDANATATREDIETVTPSAYSTMNSAKFRRDLPAPPSWFVGLLAGALSFGLVCAVVLYLVNFPAKDLNLLSKRLMVQRKRYDGYNALQQENEDARPTLSRGGSARAAPHSGRSTAVENSGSGRKRRKNLSIDTSAQYHGLGIAVPADDLREGPKLLSKCEPYDEEALRTRAQSPAMKTWEAVTAPLPALSRFGYELSELLTPGPLTSITSDTHYEMRDLEQGSSSYHSEDSRDIHLPQLFAQATQYAPTTGKQHVGLLEKVGNGVDYMAEKVARMMHDEVENAEEGLLLPVAQHEREGSGRALDL
ncbi:hypothetical protein KC340_g7866 [Hortaea werneckii]|nr:hypothetical protein KC342_g8183 [Hortaea werneckii]KAI7096808.1 hypothetical protein KC339_g10134 [Hortaea werneckii]KAI7211179.1 hypothetical protein KC365_g15054 [Hortaea werneckii]KAI7319340.1 hypothetical protein KC340_g7866 [Hortaea werneckii]KAI7372504.1 hypothetical protein KC328_g17208 [Hortaea werneckii]